MKRSRYVPARVRRELAERDELRCTYLDPDGERCAECRFLEFEHSVPYARGGQPDSKTLRLLCRGHNQLMALREFGSEHIERAIDVTNHETGTGTGTGQRIDTKRCLELTGEPWRRICTDGGPPEGREPP